MLILLLLLLYSLVFALSLGAFESVSLACHFNRWTDLNKRFWRFVTLSLKVDSTWGEVCSGLNTVQNARVERFFMIIRIRAKSKGTIGMFRNYFLRLCMLHRAQLFIHFRSIHNYSAFFLYLVIMFDIAFLRYGNAWAIKIDLPDYFHVTLSIVIWFKQISISPLIHQ